MELYIDRSGLKTYRLFISHAWRYSDSYRRLVDLLDSAPRFKWSNYSVPKHDSLDTATDKELTDALRRQIRPTQCVVIISGMYFNHSKWIQKEIDIAQEMGKPIVAIRPWGAERTPKVVQDAAKDVVGWNTSSIVNAIRRYSL